MAISLPSGAAGDHRRELTPTAALRHAWYWYIGMLFVPFLLFLAVITTLNYRGGTPTHEAMSRYWFIGSIAFLIIAGPMAFAIRSKLFRSYWRGEAVSPRNYLLGMLVVWSAFELGGIVSLVGCLVSNSPQPCLLPALAAVVFFIPFWPSGKAMGNPTGNTDDPELYSEPR